MRHRRRAPPHGTCAAVRTATGELAVALGRWAIHRRALARPLLADVALCSVALASGLRAQPLYSMVTTGDDAVGGGCTLRDATLHARLDLVLAPAGPPGSSGVTVAGHRSTPPASTPQSGAPSPRSRAGSPAAGASS